MRSFPHRRTHALPWVPPSRDALAAAFSSAVAPHLAHPALLRAQYPVTILCCTPFHLVCHSHGVHRDWPKDTTTERGGLRLGVCWAVARGVPLNPSLLGTAVPHQGRGRRRRCISSVSGVSDAMFQVFHLDASDVSDVCFKCFI